MQAVPEDLGGMGLDFKSSMVVTEGVGGGHSFAVSYSAHTGIATYLSFTTVTTSKRKSTSQASLLANLRAATVLQSLAPVRTQTALNLVQF